MHGQKVRINEYTELHLHEETDWLAINYATQIRHAWHHIEAFVKKLIANWSIIYYHKVRQIESRPRRRG